MANSISRIAQPINETIQPYAPGDVARSKLKEELKRMSTELVDVPCHIGGKDVRTGQTRKAVMPHSHREVIAEYHLAGRTEMNAAVDAALKAKPMWEAMPWQERAAIFLKAADLLAGPWRDKLNAATMLGQSKSVFQAEIDAACETIDFLRYNAYYYQQMIETQPASSAGMWNHTQYRPLEGFVLAITPFNFTAIAANLCAAPAICGNTIVWKPSDTQMRSAKVIMDLFREAGMPDGVVNMIPADGPLAGETLLAHPDLAGVHFTGSTQTFQTIWKAVGANVENYKTYPRLVGETGGKDFVFAHPSADTESLAVALVRGAFEYQGQKCSAASRAYIPKSLWPKVQERMLADIATIKVGDVRDFRNFMNAVIDERSFKKIAGYLEFVKSAPDAKIIAGGKASMEAGYFVEPTVVVTTNPRFRTMCEEIFGPVLTVYVYEDKDLEATIQLCDEATTYGLTGAIFAQDRQAIVDLGWKLRGAAGNFYVNDKPTGAVVGQQPFGGARKSGTNDKSGGAYALIRWTSMRTIKETMVPARDYRYPFLGAE